VKPTELSDARMLHMIATRSKRLITITPPEVGYRWRIAACGEPEVVSSAPTLREALVCVGEKLDLW